MIDEFYNAKVVIKEGPNSGKIGHVFCVDEKWCDVYLVEGVSRIPKENLKILPSNL